MVSRTLPVNAKHIADTDRLQMRVKSPFGFLTLTQAGDHLAAIDWEHDDLGGATSTPLLKEAGSQLTAYFEGRLKEFELPLRPGGDSFQQAVCTAMLEIPYGETTTYGAIAEKLDTFGQPVGNACGLNTIPIIIPCHRVLAANGIGGYSGDGGVERKIELLKMEGGYPYLL